MKHSDADDLKAVSFSLTNKNVLWSQACEESICVYVIIFRIPVHILFPHNLIVSTSVMKSCCDLLVICTTALVFDTLKNVNDTLQHSTKPSKKNLTKLLGYKAFSRTELTLYFGVAVIQYDVLQFNGKLFINRKLSQIGSFLSHELNSHNIFWGELKLS